MSEEYDQHQTMEIEAHSPVRQTRSASFASSATSSTPSVVSVPTSQNLSDAALLADEEDYIRVVNMIGYVFDWSLEIRYWIVALLTGFLSCLLGYWFPKVQYPLRYRAVPDLQDAEYITIESQDGDIEFLTVEKISLHPSCYVPRILGQIWYGPTGLTDRNSPAYIPPSERMFVFRHHRFFLDIERSPPTFIKQHEPLQESAGKLFDRLKTGLSSVEHAKRQMLFGINQLQIMVPTYPVLLMKELFHPFFIFQIYSVILWCFEEYYIFALCIAVIASVSIVTTLLETHSRLANLSQLARFEVDLNVLRHDAAEPRPKIQKMSSVDLVVGDVVEVETGIIPCDLTILSGGAVVNEAMLTGEAIPISKCSIQFPLNPSHLVPLGIESRSTLYSATRVLQLKPTEAGGKVYGLVVRTGFATTKGSLILSILYPKPSSFKFLNQSYKFIASLFVMSLFGFAISIWQLNRHDAPVGKMIIRGLDLITIVVPPSLPLALSVGVNFALIALKAHKIFCISPSRINLAGKIQWMCFDKTGTLTSEGMELMGCLPTINGIYGQFYTTSTATDREKDETGVNGGVRSLGVGEIGIDIESGVRPSTDESDPRGSGGLLVRGGKLLGWSNLSEDSTSSTSRARSGTGEEAMIRLNEIETDTHSLNGPLSSSHQSSSLLSYDVLACMSSCHAIAVLDGELIGDPLEIEIFKATNAVIRDPTTNPHEDSRGYVHFISCPSALVDEPTNEWGVKFQFEFVPALQRMSVIAVNQTETRPMPTSPDQFQNFSSSSSSPSSAPDIRALVKGSPEIMKTLCRPDTIPHDFDRILKQYAHKGFRIIAMGWKPLDGIPKMEKEDLRLFIESDLIFLGLLILENKIKPETAPTLKILHEALVRCVMVTGDNPLTGISVCKDSGLIKDQGTRIFVGSLINDPQTGQTSLEWTDSDDSATNSPPLKLNPRTLALENTLPCKYELAITGNVYKYLEERHLAEIGSDRAPKNYLVNTHDPAEEDTATRYFHRVILNCLVFSRMTPDQKASLISHLQSLGIYTGMCGDGANDVGALKAGHIGVSLSDSEASIAAPFTYQRPNISCIPILLSEGRSSLMTSFQLFKYMAMYSMIQFTAVIMLYFKGSVLGNWEYLYQDMFLVFPLTIAIGGTKSTPHLSRKRPSGNLLSGVNILCVLGHMVICFCFQILVFSVSQNQDDFFPYESQLNFDQGPQTYESTSVYYYSNFQYIVMALLFARGSPWKSSILTNFKFMGWWCLTVIITLALLFSQHQGSFFRSEEVPVGGYWRGIMFLIMLTDVICNVIFNVLIFPFFVNRYKLWRKNRYRLVQVYGKLKTADGPQSKLYHRLRGEFEANWRHQ